MAWHFNLSTKGNGFTDGMWLLRATLEDRSQPTVWITIKMQAAYSLNGKQPFLSEGLFVFKRKTKSEIGSSKQ